MVFITPGPAPTLIRVGACARVAQRNGHLAERNAERRITFEPG
jgi:hypothetical protein